MGAEFVGRSPGLGDDMGFVLTDPATLQAKVRPNIFALGDATNVPASKAGSVAHFQAEILTENVVAYLAERELPASFDGHSNCFIETGYGRGLRSEEHTSELQSHSDLVCRLLLEKK